jgi:hypothetical protein
MKPYKDDQQVALAILELEACSGQRWQDIADATLHEAIAMLISRPSEEQMRNAVRYIKRWRDHAVHGQPLPPSLVLLNAEQNNVLGASRRSAAMTQARAVKADEPTSSPPGTCFAQILQMFMTARAFRRYVYPAITEMQAEHYEALHAGGCGKARWVLIRGHLLALPAFFYGLVAQGIRRFLAR